MNRRLDPALIRAVVFDFDGTLARLNIDFSVMRAAVRELIRQFRIPEIRAVRPHVLETVDAAMAYLREVDPGQAESFLAAASERITDIELRAAEQGALLEGTRGLLSDLSGRSILTGVVTRNCRTAVLRIFPDIHDYCRAFLSRDDTDRVKPHPDHLRSVLRMMDVVPARCAMVGDHPMDILLGRKAGACTIGVLTGHSGRKELLEAKADIIVEKAPDILKLL